MKMSLCQMIAVVCILAVGFLTITPFVPEVDADPYVTSVHYVTGYVYCGGWSPHLLSVTTLSSKVKTASHSEAHHDYEHPAPDYFYKNLIRYSSDECSICVITIPPEITSN